VKYSHQNSLQILPLKKPNFQWLANVASHFRRKLSGRRGIGRIGKMDNYPKSGAQGHSYYRESNLAMKNTYFIYENPS